MNVFTIEANTFLSNLAPWGAIDLEIYAGKIFLTSNLYFQNFAFSKDGVAAGSVIKLLSSLISNTLVISKNATYIQNNGLARGKQNVKK